MKRKILFIVGPAESGKTILLHHILDGYGELEVYAFTGRLLPETDIYQHDATKVIYADGVCEMEAACLVGRFNHVPRIEKIIIVSNSITISRVREIEAAMQVEFDIIQLRNLDE